MIPVNHKSKLAAATLIAAAVVSACFETVPLVESAAPLQLGDALAYFDYQNSSIVIVDPNGKAGPDGDRQIVRLPAGTSPVQVVHAPRPDQPELGQLVVLDPGEGALHLIRDKRGTTKRIDIGVPFDTIDISADGRFAVAYQPEGQGPTRSLFALPNQVAVIDLHPDSPRATTVGLGSGSAHPRRALFGGELRLDNQVVLDGEVVTVSDTVALSLIFLDGAIAPVDLENGAVGPLVPLTGDRLRGNSVSPEEVLFTANRGDEIRGSVDSVERAFVRTTNGDLFVLAVSLSSTRLAGDSDAMALMVALENIVTPDAFVYDVELFFDQDGSALLLAAAGNELILVNGYTGVASRFAQEAFVDSLTRFVDPVTGRAVALGYSRHMNQKVVLRIDPLALDRRRSTGVRPLYLANDVTDIQLRPGADRAVLHYANNQSLGLLELAENGEVLDLRFASTPSAQTLAPAGDRIWLVAESPEDQAPYLAELELEQDLRSVEMRLDLPARAIGRVGSYIWVDHAAASGAVTFVPTDNLSREQSLMFREVLLVDLFDLEPSP